MKRVLLVIPSLANAGGAESLAVNLSALLKEFYDVNVATFDKPGTATYFPLSVPIHQLGDALKLPLPLRFLSYIWVSRKLTRLKRGLSVDISLSILWRADLINSLSRNNEKIVSLLVINLIGNPSNIIMTNMRFLVRFVFKRFDAVLAITREISREFVSLYGRDVCRTGVFRTFFPAPTVTRTSLHDGVRFVFCGRAVIEKNIAGLLAAFARTVMTCPHFQLILIGDGPMLNDIKKIAVNYGLTIGKNLGSKAQLLFVGGVNNPQDYMVGACAFVMTSKHEGIPTAAILAANLGLPLLVADCRGGGMRDLFDLPLDTPLPALGRNGVEVPAGLLLPIPEPDNIDTLEIWAAAFKEAATNDALRKKRVEGALRLAAARSPGAVRLHWKALIEDVTEF